MHGSPCEKNSNLNRGRTDIVGKAYQTGFGKGQSCIFNLETATCYLILLKNDFTIQKTISKWGFL